MHTPGPWFSTKSESVFCVEARVGNDMQLIAQCDLSANASLIECAPDLLDAAMKLLEQVDQGDGEIRYHLVKRFRDAVARINGVVA